MLTLIPRVYQLAIGYFGYQKTLLTVNQKSEIENETRYNFCISAVFDFCCVYFNLLSANVGHGRHDADVT